MQSKYIQRLFLQELTYTCPAAPGQRVRWDPQALPLLQQPPAPRTNQRSKMGADGRLKQGANPLMAHGWVAIAELRALCVPSARTCCFGTPSSALVLRRGTATWTRDPPKTSTAQGGEQISEQERFGRIPSWPWLLQFLNARLKKTQNNQEHSLLFFVLFNYLKAVPAVCI